MGVSQPAPQTVTLLDEQCRVAWASTNTGWCFGHVIVHGRPLAQLEWCYNHLRSSSVERAATALRSYRASGCRWSVTDRRDGCPGAPLDLERCLRGLTPRAALTFHRYRDQGYWCLDSGIVDAAFLLWDVQLAEDVARRVRAIGGNLDLAGKLRPPVYLAKHPLAA